MADSNITAKMVKDRVVELIDYVDDITGESSANLGNAIGKIKKVSVATPTVTAQADDEESEIYVNAYTNQPSGYTKGGLSAVVGRAIKLKIEGDTAVMYADETQQIRRKVIASLATCDVTISFGASVGYVCVTATTFEDGAIGCFAQGKSSGEFTINNVVCGSVISVIGTNYFSISSSMDRYGGFDGLYIALKAPNDEGNYTVTITEYDD